MKKKILILVNTLSSVNAFIYSNHCQFWTRTVKDFPDFEFIFLTPYRMSIDMARNLAAKQALALNCDYLMFIDDDVLIPADTFKKLYEAEKDVIAGLGCIRGFPFDNMIFKEHIREEVSKTAQGEVILDSEGKEIILQHRELSFYNELPKNEDGSLVELVECGAVGFSCCLLNMDVLRLLEPPYFITLPSCTEDVYFCNRLIEELTPTPTIFCHTGVQWGHMLNSEPIEYGTKKKFQEFYSERAIENGVQEEQHRDLEYISKVIARM